jgi:hypothetical protein
MVPSSQIMARAIQAETLAAQGCKRRFNAVRAVRLF